MESRAAPQAADKSVPLAVIIVVWYASSVVCMNTNKSLTLAGWSSMDLTLAQLYIGTLCSVFVMLVCRLFPYTPIKSFLELKLTAALSLVFVLGFVTLNSAFKYMPVGLVMTLRATEPLVTAVVVQVFLPSERLTLYMWLALLPVILGASLAVMGGTAFSLLGIVLSCASNVCFALRGLLTKMAKESYVLDDYSLFLHLCALGVVVQHTLYAAAVASDMPGVGAMDLSTLIAALPSSLSDLWGRHELLLNGLTFWLYLQLSWLALGRMPAVSHSVVNAMRRPVICVCEYLQFGGSMSWLNVFGIALASGGVLVYSHVKRAETERLKACLPGNV
jgi:solute carrier family 35 protein E1